MSANINRNAKMVELKRFAELIIDSDDITKAKQRMNGFRQGYCRGNFYPQKEKRLKILDELLDSYR